MTTPLNDLFRVEHGLVSRKVFFDPEVYRLELERIFARCWLFVGHESQLARPGDYLTNWMGEDPVIVVRDVHGAVRVFLNSCRHRGMKVCRADVGHATVFQCSFHGWTYSTEGALTGVPYQKEAYGGELDRTQWGLREAPRVQTYGGLIFACWDAGAVSLDDYLGDLRWYFDVMLERHIGGIEVIPGQQRYRIAANWKIAAENFAGDTYHIPYAHGSTRRLGVRNINPVGLDFAAQQYSVAFAHGHGLTSVAVGGERYRMDRTLAEGLGPEVVEYVDEIHDRLRQRLSPRQADVYGLSFGNVFPHFSFNDFSALRPLGFYLWQPTGPQMLEARMWSAVDRAAPKVVKEMARVDFSRTQATSGIAAQDDSENFEQVTEATRGVVGQELDFIYLMGKEREGELQVEGCPGRLGPYFSEHCQRNLYRYWAELMRAGA